MSPARGSVVTLLSQASIAALTLAATVVVGRTLGPASRGAVAVALLTPLLFATLGSLGLGTASTYFTARDPQRLREIVGTGLAIAAGLGSAAVAGFAACRAIGLLPSTSGLGVASVIALAAIPPAFLLHDLLANALRGIDRIVSWNAMYLLQSASNLAILLALAGLGALTITSAIVSMAVSYGISVACGLAAIARTIEARPQFDRSLVIPLLRYGLRTHLAGVAFFLNYRLDSLLLQSLAGNYEAGLYATAVAPSEAAWMLGTAISAVAFPRLVALAGSGVRESTRRLLGCTLGLTAIVVAALATAGPALIVLAYGEAFRPAVLPFYLLLPGTLAFSIVKLLWVYFVSRDQALHVAAVIAGATALDAAAIVVLAPRFGAVGAAIAASVSYALASATLLALFAPPRQWPRGLASVVDDLKRAVSGLHGRRALPSRRG